MEILLVQNSEISKSEGRSFQRRYVSTSRRYLEAEPLVLSQRTDVVITKYLLLANFKQTELRRFVVLSDKKGVLGRSDLNE